MMAFRRNSKIGSSLGAGFEPDGEPPRCIGYGKLQAHEHPSADQTIDSLAAIPTQRTLHRHLGTRNNVLIGRRVSGS